MGVRTNTTSSTSSASSHSADLRQFISQLKKIEQAHKHDFIVIDTPGGVQHLSLIAHGMADTLITPINDSLLDLDVLVAIERSDLEPQPSVYAKTVRRALDARRKVSGRADRLDCGSEPPGISPVKQSAPDQSGPGRNSNDTGFSDCTWFVGATRISRVFRLWFDGVRPDRRAEECCGIQPSNLLARVEVQNLIREIELIDEADLEDEAFHEIELEVAEANAEANDVVTDKEDLSEETDKRAVTLAPGLPAG